MQFTSPRAYRRKPSLTPMIDVVFLLLVFFMLASRFGVETVLPLPLANGGADVSGKPRLVDILPDGLRLNGIDRSAPQLLADLNALVQSPEETVILRSTGGATVQQIVTTAQMLRDAGFSSLILVE
ncbi:MAG: indolepyruvate ferredoxin oxidoreductase [Rhodobacteraceae bacterium]|nr:indolepyruvate ferredoxin oxidoreductase [Paracoccaceae bacterium]